MSSIFRSITHSSLTHRMFKQIWGSYDTISKFEDLFVHFTSLETGMTHRYKFKVR
jgi:hypothetical protein